MSLCRCAKCCPELYLQGTNQFRPDHMTPPMNYRPLTYLTCPYTHPDPAVSEARFRAATRATAWLMNNTGWNVMSPITHSHPLHALAGMRGDWAFWKKVDTEFIGCSSRIVNLVIPGWHESTGVDGRK